MAKKILVVEDELSILNVLNDKFSNEGFEVIRAVNGKEGLDVALLVHPDIILLDIIMPIMDGMTMIQELRKDPWGKNAKVIMLTNLSEPTSVTESLNQGVRDYLIKSDWTMEDIVKRINDSLK